MGFIMKQHHIYEYDYDVNGNTAPAHVVRMVGREKRVLELGCGPGAVTRVLTGVGKCKLTALDIDSDSVQMVKPYCENVIQADLNSDNWPMLLPTDDLYDVVVAVDVLEHLYDPLSVLKLMGKFVEQDGYLVTSLPHVGHAAITACLINGNFTYRDWGLLDRTHIRFFCLKNIEELFEKAGLKITEAQYVVKAPEDTEFSMDWFKLPARTRDVLEDSKHAYVYQVVVKSVPIGRTDIQIHLEAPPKGALLKRRLHFWKKYFASHLSSRAKHKIRKYFNLFGINI